jgi:hypothetical protein
MNRLKAIYRSWAIPCAGQQVYSPRHRAAWLEKLREAGVRRRAEQTYQQLDFLMGIRKETRKELLAESRKHPARQLLEQIPRLGPIRVALLIALFRHRIVSARSANYGTTAGWACGPGAAANIGTPGDNCSMRGNHRRCAVSTSTIIMI